MIGFSLEQQVVAFISSWGAVNGFILSSYFLLINKKRKLSDYFLGGLILVVSIRIIKSFLLNLNSQYIEGFILLNLIAGLLIGPFLYLHLRSVVQEKRKFGVAWWWHVLPYVLIILAVADKYPIYEHIAQWKQLAKLVYLQWLTYILISGFILKDVLKMAWKQNKKLSDQKIWLLVIYFGTLIIWLACITSPLTSCVVGAVSFSVVLYIFLLHWVSKKLNRRDSSNPPPKYANSSLSSVQTKAYMDKLSALMQSEKLYLDPHLTLAKLSEHLSIKSKDLSQVINQNTEYNYSRYIASLRVEEAKRLLSSPEHRHYKISFIGYDSGFGSLSSFNATFKQFTGITPKEYRKQS